MKAKQTSKVTENQLRATHHFSNHIPSVCVSAMVVESKVSLKCWPKIYNSTQLKCDHCKGCRMWITLFLYYRTTHWHLARCEWGHCHPGRDHSHQERNLLNVICTDASRQVQTAHCPDLKDIGHWLWIGTKNGCHAQQSVIWYHKECNGWKSLHSDSKTSVLDFFPKFLQWLDPFCEVTQ